MVSLIFPFELFCDFFVLVNLSQSYDQPNRLYRIDYVYLFVSSNGVNNLILVRLLVTPDQEMANSRWFL